MATVKTKPKAKAKDAVLSKLKKKATTKATASKASAKAGTATKAKAVVKKAKAKVAAKPKTKAAARPKDIATEIEKSGNPAMIRAAIKRLAASGKPRKELLVPNTDMDKAKEIAKEIIKGKMTIQNLSRTARKFVR
ncbi:MAG: hypothetical protein K6T91_00015 [Firmicutes bacterium]|nr:hypothetical protein [Bacillota bacterium]